MSWHVGAYVTLHMDVTLMGHCHVMPFFPNNVLFKVCLERQG